MTQGWRDVVTWGLAMVYGFVGTLGALRYSQTEAVSASPPTEVSALPPEEFAGGAQVTVRFVQPYMIVDECGLDAVACAHPESNRIVVLNPCVLGSAHGLVLYQQRPPRRPLEVRINENEFTRQLCHELGHVDGWRHGDGPIVSRYPGGEAE